MRKTTVTAIFCALVGLSAAVQADSGSTTARDDCISNLRGLAEQNAAKQGFTVVKIDVGQYAMLADGGAKCAAQFVIIKKDSTQGYSQIFSGQVAAASGK